MSQNQFSSARRSTKCITKLAKASGAMAAGPLSAIASISPYRVKKMSTCWEGHTWGLVPCDVHRRMCVVCKKKQMWLSHLKMWKTVYENTGKIPWRHVKRPDQKP